MKPIGGKFTLSCDGNVYYTQGTFKYGGGYDKREAVMHSGGSNAGFKVTPVTPYISGDVIDNGTFKLSEIANIVDATITLDLANGRQIVLRNAYSTNDNGLEVDTDGKITVKFEGQKIEDVVSI